MGRACLAGIVVSRRLTRSVANEYTADCRSSDGKTVMVKISVAPIIIIAAPVGGS